MKTNKRTQGKGSKSSAKQVVRRNLGILIALFVILAVLLFAVSGSTSLLSFAKGRVSDTVKRAQKNQKEAVKRSVKQQQKQDTGPDCSKKAVQKPYKTGGYTFSEVYDPCSSAGQTGNASNISVNDGGISGNVSGYYPVKVRDPGAPVWCPPGWCEVTRYYPIEQTQTSGR